MSENDITKRAASPAGLTSEKAGENPQEDNAAGLTAAEAARRFAAGQGNTPVEAPTKSVKQIIYENIFTFFNLIFVVLGVCLAMVGAFLNMFFLVVATANTLIGIVQEIRSKRTIDKLTLLNAPKSTVIRDGNTLTLPSELLVLGDVVVFSAGNQLPADGTVLCGEIQVNESLLTGEPDSIPKPPGAKLLSGSFVVAGSCRARLTGVGAESYAAKLTLEAKKSRKVQKSEMMRSLDRLIKVIGIALIPMGIALFYNQYISLRLDIYHAVTGTVAALLGMIPEGLFLLTSMALAVSVLRLARKKTLVQEMGCIETLARVDVLCVDKTGTITEPGMQVSGIFPLSSSRWDERAAGDIFKHFYAASSADNDTARAMAAQFSGKSDWEAEKVVPFTSDSKWSGVTFLEKGSYVVGAPEFIMGERYIALKSKVEEYSANGERVLLLAHHEGKLTAGALTGAVTPIALARIANKIRDEAPATFRYFAEQGVAVKVISGDNPLTVSQVALRAGIGGAEAFVDASSLKTDDDIAAAAEKYTVFGRVTPDQKRKLVLAMKEAGHTVAMTGDGVNDVLALKDANVGIAMASGADAACQAAHLVLLTSNFSALPEVVLEGRRVINNIQRASSLFLVKNIFSFILTLVTILFTNMPYPLEPLQLSMIGAFTIGIPSFFLALEPNRAIVRGHFLRNVLGKALPGALTNVFLILLAELCTIIFGFSYNELSTLACILVSFNGLVVLFRVCKPFDLKRRLLWGAMAAGVVGAIVLLGGLFSLLPLTPKTGAVLASLMALSLPFHGLVLFAMSKCERALHAQLCNNV